MKKFNYFTAAGLALASLAVGASLAIAETTSVSPSSVSSPENKTPATPAMMITINQNSKGRIAGTVASVSASTLSVNSWGGVWVVDISNAKLVRRYGGTASISEFQKGDGVVVSGTVSGSGFAVTATEVQNTSIQTRNVNPSGTVSNVTSDGFTLTAKSATYSVIVGSNTTINLNGKKTTAADITNGVKVQVWGVLDRTQSIITATRVNISIPRVYYSGTASGVSAAGFILTTAAGKTYAVTLGANAVVKINDTTGSLSAVPEGAKASVSGLANGDSGVTANAVSVRIPRVKPTTTTTNTNTGGGTTGGSPNGQQ